MTITKGQLIKEIAKREDLSISTVQALYQTLEDYIFEILSSTTPSEKIEINLFNGISIDCSYKKEKKIVHPKSGKLFETNAKIWAKPKITRYYNRKLNGYFDDKS